MLMEYSSTTIGTPPRSMREPRSKCDVVLCFAVLKKELKPAADLYNSSATKLHLAGVLLDRAWNTLRT